MKIWKGENANVKGEVYDKNCESLVVCEEHKLKPWKLYSSLYFEFTIFKIKILNWIK